MAERELKRKPDTSSKTDEVLESNAEDFVHSYVQKGGE